MYRGDLAVTGGTISPATPGTQVPHPTSRTFRSPCGKQWLFEDS